MQVFYDSPSTYNIISMPYFHHIKNHTSFLLSQPNTTSHHTTYNTTHHITSHHIPPHPTTHHFTEAATKLQKSLELSSKMLRDQHNIQINSLETSHQKQLQALTAKLAAEADKEKATGWLLKVNSCLLLL